jgi:hypothetical protein
VASLSIVFSRDGSYFADTGKYCDLGMGVCYQTRCVRRQLSNQSFSRFGGIEGGMLLFILAMTIGQVTR